MLFCQPFESGIYIPDNLVNHRIQHHFVLILYVLLLSSCVTRYSGPVTPTPPSNMAFVDIPKPHPGEVIPSTVPSITTIPVISTATAIQNIDTMGVAVWVPAYLSETMGGALDDSLRGLLVSDETIANIKLEVGEENVVSQWVYALVTPFSSPTMQGISGDDLLARWRGTATGTPLLMDKNTYDIFTALWGTAGTSVQVLPKNELIDYAWTHQPTLAIVPFEESESTLEGFTRRRTLAHPQGF